MFMALPFMLDILKCFYYSIFVRKALALSLLIAEVWLREVNRWRIKFLLNILQLVATKKQRHQEKIYILPLFI